MYDALVLAGGAARRMGGLDKAAMTVGACSLLDRVLMATGDAVTTVVVGPERATCMPVIWTREQPVARGPVAALAAGLELVTAQLVVLVAADLPFLTVDVVGHLVDAVEHDGALLVDAEGRDQYLCSAWRSASLRQADLSLDRLSAVFASLETTRVWVPPAPGSPAPWTDCDTQEELLSARRWAEETT